MSAFEKTGRMLESLAQRHDSILIGTSGGKDSLAVTSLCAKYFRRVVAFHQHLAPGLEITAQRLALTRERWGIEVHEYPSHAFVEGLQQAYYCDPDPRWRRVQPVNPNDLGMMLMRRLGIKIMANGARVADYRNRRRQIACEKRPIVFPISEWSKAHVLRYLLAEGIPIPDSDGRSSTGLNFTKRSLLWLADAHPRDFRWLCKFFPYAAAQAHRRLLDG